MSWERRFADELQAWLAPVVETEGQPDRVLALLHATGWHVEALAVGNQQALTTAFGQIATVGKSLFDALITPPAKIEEFLLEVGPKVAVAMQAIPGLASALPAGLPAATSELPADLLNWLTIEWLRRHHGLAFTGLQMIGVIRKVPQLEESFNGAVYRTKNAVPCFSPDALVRLLHEPHLVLKEAFWAAGTTDTDGAIALALELWSLADVLGLTNFLPLIAPSESFDPDAPVVVVDPDTVRLTKIVPLTSDTTGELGVIVKRIAAADGGPGALLTPFGEFTGDFDLGLAKLELRGTLAANPIRIVPAGVSQVDGARPNFGATIQLTRGDSTTPALHLGDKDGLELTLETVSFYAGVMLPPGRPRALFGVDLKSFLFSLKAGDGDGFLAAILPADGISGNASFAIEWSTDGGIAIRGGGGLTISIPTHIQLGPIDIQQLVISATPAGRDVPIELSASIAAKLGPLAIVVERMGVSAKVSLPDGGGNLGPFDVTLGFKPPKGVGLAVDAGAVKGGGYLYFDFDKEEYAGVLELSIANFLTLTAVGLVTTRMPDGSKGFSLLIIITAEFGTGLQLGYGFTLIGVGGLLGLNRTVRLQPLVDGVRTGAVNNIMFPKNVVANAPRIISDLRAIFPPFEGKFLIGPMAKLGWGSPPLITLSLGVIIEIPGDLKILGVLKCILPDEKTPVLILQVAFVGAIEFDKKRLWLFAGIFDSKVLTFTLEGEMGVLFAWGDDADFVISVGGFHPRFTPPPLPFSSPKRLAISILDEDQARIRVSCYFAVTTNTVQFGARAELFFGFSAISVEGHFQFDALFQFSPFYFVIELSTSVALKVGGTGLLAISMDLALEGPTPWHAKGSGSIKILFFEISANFDETWGEEKDTTLPPIDVFPLLAEELAKEQNWSALPPTSGSLLVALRVVGDKKEFVLHPVGALRVAQRAVPLNSTIDLFGSQKPADVNHFTLAVTTPGLAVAKRVREQFAPAQFHALSRAEKLAAPAFSQEDGGVDISATGNAMRSSLVVRRVVRYEQIIIDSNFKRFQQRFVTFTGTLFRHFLGGNAAARSVLSAQLKNQMQPFKDVITTDAEGFGVANTSNNKLVAGAKVFGSYHAAKEHMEQEIAQNPGLAGKMHVVPDFELNKAA